VALFEAFAARFGYVLEYQEEVSEDTSIGEVLRALVAEEGLSGEALRRHNFARSRQVVAAGAEMEELSLRWIGSDEALGGGDVLFPGGYVQVAQGVAQGLDVRLEHVVEGIQYGPEGVLVATNQGNFEAYAAIVTLPLGVLKAGVVEFDPPLPARKRAAIDRLGMGVLNKVAVRFEEAFWPMDSTFLGNVSETPGVFNAYLNQAAVKGDPILMCLTGGNFAREIEGWSDEELLEGVLSPLQRIFGAEMSDPVGMVRARWASDPFAGGSYSHIRPGSSPQDRLALAAPAGGTLFFAGEATTGEDPGTVHGAYSTGLRAAEEVWEAAG